MSMMYCVPRYLLLPDKDERLLILDWMETAGFGFKRKSQVYECMLDDILAKLTGSI